MNNKLIFLVLSSLLITITIADVPTCKNHPAYTKAQKMIKDSVQNDSTGSSKGLKLLQAFENAVPQTLTADDLGVCSQYEKQKSCCNKNVTKLLDKAALLSVKKLLASKSAFQKLATVYSNQVKKQSCTPTKTLNADVIMADTTLTNFQKSRNDQKACKITFGKAISALTRGAMCTICSGVDKVSDYFDANGLLKITPASQTAFQNAASSAVDCIANTITQSNLGTILDELNGAYLSDSTCKTNVKNKVLNIFSNVKVSKDDDKGKKKCSGQSVFAQSSDCQNSVGGGSDLETATRLLRMEQDNIFRMLQSSDDAVVDANGVNIYVASDLDNQADENGSYNVDFSDVDDTSNNSNNSLNLIFGSLIVLISFIL